MDNTTRVLLEAVYAALLSAVVELAKALGKPSPIANRAERRAAQQNQAQQR